MEKGQGQGALAMRSVYHRRKLRFSKLYFGTQYFSLTILELQYFAPMFHIVQQQLREYTTALQDVLSYVTSSVFSATYFEPVPNASDHIDYRHLFEEVVTAV